MKKIEKYILNGILSGPLFKHFERDYSIFFLSSFGNSHAVANQVRFGNDGLTLALMTFYDNISSYYRLEQDNEVYAKNIAKNIAKDKSVKDEIFTQYTFWCRKMRRLYKQIEQQENFKSNFILEFSSTITKLVTYQILIIHKVPSFIKVFAKTPKAPDEIYAIRKKNENVFGNFETKFELLCSKIIKSLSLSNMVVADFKYLTAENIVSILESGLKPEKLIAERKAGVVINYLPNLEILTGKAAKKIISAIDENEKKYHPISKMQNMVKGKTVFGAGKLTGVCRMITDYNRVGDLKRGEILVTPSTLPKYNAVYRRAKAIITNEGGVLAHVSIFCREFKIMGIVGTKIATKVFNDGDKVEVDANKGIVRILQKAK